MVITWKFPVHESELTAKKLEQIASIVETRLGFDNEEITIHANKILVSPEFGRRMFGMQTFRLALYDLIVSKEKRNLVFRFRFFAMYIFMILPALFFGSITQSILTGALIFGCCALFIIPFKWIQNRIHKFRMESEIKQILS